MDFVKGIAQAIAQAAELEVSDIETAVEIPADTKMGDYAFPCFRLAKTLRKAPPLFHILYQQNFNSLFSISDTPELCCLSNSLSNTFYKIHSHSP